LAGEDIATVLPEWAGQFKLADRKSAGELAKTLTAYADANMNLLQTAKLVSVHPNTIYARLQKIQEMTGMDARTYHGLTELLIAIKCWSRAKNSVQ